MDVIERLHASSWSVREIAERAGLPWRIVDALVTRTMPDDRVRLPPELLESLDRVLPKLRRVGRGGYATADKPLVGTRMELPVVIVGSQPARVVAWLAAHDSGTTAEIAAALLPSTCKKPTCAMGSVLSRMIRDTDLLRADPGVKPYRYRLTPMGWRVADALARWRARP